MINLKRKYFKSIFSYLKPYIGTLIFMFLGMILSQGCALLLPDLMSKIIDVGIKQNGFENPQAVPSGLSSAEILKNQTSYILHIGIIMFALTLATVIITIWINRVVSKMSAGISLNLRKDLFSKVIDFSYEEAGEFSNASLITRMTNDTEHVKSLLLTVTQIFTPPIMMAGGIIMALRNSVSMSWTIALGGIVSAAGVIICFKLIMPRIKLLQALADKFNLVIKERLSGTVITKTFGNENFEENRFKESNLKLADTSMFVNRIMIMITPVLTVLMNFISVAIIWMGAGAVSRCEMKVGEVMAFLQYSMLVISAFLMLSFMIAMIPKAWVSVERVFEILNKESGNYEKDLKSLSENFKGNIKFENVSFKYKGAKECVLENLNFEISAGQKIGIVGTTGSGKSTVIKLLLGLYTPFEGNIFFDGVNLKSIKKSSVREIAAYASQNEILFSGDILSNLKLGNENASNDEISEALKIAQMEDFVKENGTDYKISRSGSNVSGGQRQRLTIARAILKKARMYIFDDSFSKLDFKTDFALRKRLAEKLENKTVFMISQRIGTIKNCDKILVLDGGKLVGNSEHENLIKTCGVYRETARLQMGEEALR